MSTTTGGDLNLVKPELTDDHKVTIGTDLPANFQKIDDAVSAHLADTTTAHGINAKANKSDISNMHVINFSIPKSSSRTVSFTNSGHFMILAHVASTAQPQVGVYAAHTYVVTPDRWTITTLNAEPNLTITTGDGILTFANSHSNQQLDITIISYFGATMLVS